MKLLKLWWEGRDWDVDISKDCITPLTILEQIGKEGRNAFIEILLINYKEEVEEEQKLLNRPRRVLK